MLSTLRPMISHPRSVNSLWRLANSTNSVVQTGVKSAGCAKKRTHLPRYCDRLRGPLVLLAVKSGAFEPILTIGASFRRKTLKRPGRTRHPCLRQSHRSGLIARVKRLPRPRTPGDRIASLLVYPLANGERNSFLPTTSPLRYRPQHQERLTRHRAVSSGRATPASATGSARRSSSERVEDRSG